MTDPVPHEIGGWRDLFVPTPTEELTSDESFRLDDVEFVCKYVPSSTSRRFSIVKPPGLIDRYRRLCERDWRNARIVELGILEGGSTALLALLAAPSCLIAVDRRAEPVRALDEFIRERGLSDVVRPHYGVDQSDRARLAHVVDADREGEPLDLVVDDASHKYTLTKSSFETLFPRLRPGGTFVIEDWSVDHALRDVFRASFREALQDPSSPDRAERLRKFQESSGERGGPQDIAPLSRLVIELMLARASTGEAIEAVSIDEFWVAVRRGTATLEPGTFRLDDLYHDYFDLLGPLDSGNETERQRIRH